jgi:hypothetical protein
MKGNEEITQRGLETRIVSVLSVKVLSVSQLSKELGVKRYILTGYLEAMKNQGKLSYHKVGKSNCYTIARTPVSYQTARKRIMPIIILVTFFAMAQVQAATAAPSITNLSLSPSQDLWVGEGLTISLRCTDDANLSISSATAEVTGSGGYSIPDKSFTSSQGGSFSLYIDPIYLSSPDDFNVAIKCISEDDSVTSTSAEFTVSNLSMDLTLASGSQPYLGDSIEMDAMVRKNSVTISSGPQFSVQSNGNPATLKVAPPFDPSKGWILYMNSPSSSGSYDLAITATYGRASVTRTVPVKIIDPIQFYISSTDKRLVSSEEIVTFSIYAIDHGSGITVTKDNLQIRVGSSFAIIDSITPVSNYYSVSAIMPGLIPGSYQATAVLSYKGYSYSSTTNLNFVVPVSGKLTDDSGHGVPATIRFSQDGNERNVLYTDSNGAYSGELTSGTYEISASLTHTSFVLYGTTVDSFDDPIKHYFLTTGGPAGLDVAGVYVYEATVPYKNASVEMKYDESSVGDESSIKIYRCDSWNTGKLSCYSGWKEAFGYVDTLRNTVYVNTSSLSTFAIGSLKSLSFDFNLNKKEYALNDLIKVRGMVVDSSQTPVQNATVIVRIPEAMVVHSTTTDSNGLFSFDLTSPSIEGTYTVRLSSEKSPYVLFNSSSSFVVKKSSGVSIVGPETVKAQAGSVVTEEFTITNIGQTDLLGINITLESIPSWYYSIVWEAKSLKSKENAIAKVTFIVPKNATASTTGLTLRVANAAASAEKVFGFTVTEAEASQDTSAPATGQFWNLGLPKIPDEAMYLTCIAVVSFVSAFLIKKHRIKNERGKDSKNVTRESFGEVGRFVDSQLKGQRASFHGNQAPDRRIPTQSYDSVKREKN